MFDKRVPIDKYLLHKDEYKDCCSEYMTVTPVDMNGNTVPLGISVADKARNIKKVTEDIKYRLGC